MANNASNQSGEPTEAALYLGAKEAGFLSEQIRQKFPRKGEKPFDSGRKRMSVWCLDRENASEWIFAKGALESVLSCCKTIYGNNGVKDLSGEEIRKLKEQSQQWGREGMRVLAFACRQLPEGKEWGEEHRNWEHDLTFLGMAALTDPLRPESKAAVAAARAQESAR